MNNCEKYEKIIPLYLDQDLSRSESEELEKHIDGCPWCARTLEQHILLESSLLELKDELPQPSFVSESVLKRLNIKKHRFIFSSIFRVPVLIPVSMVISAIAVIFFQKELTLIIDSFSLKYNSFIDSFSATGTESIARQFSGTLTDYCGSVAGFIESLGMVFLRIGEIDLISLISISTGMTLIIILWFTHLTKQILQD